jgi:hypothetical protein
MLKFWPEKRWKKIMLITFLILIAVGAPIVAYLEYSVYREVVTSVEIKNSAGTKNALLVYHPGLSSFSHDVSYTFAEGLASNNWRVEIATASSQTPANLSNYDLLVLSWPIYDFGPGPTITNYVKRVSDLQGIETVIITTGGGVNPFNAQDAMQNTVQQANGTIKELVTIFRGGNITDKALNAAKDIIP